MTLAGCCPSCGFKGDAEAWLVEPDARRLIARVAAIDPVLARVAIPYLRLFGSGKRAVRLTRAIKLIDELLVLVEPGTVCRDERGGVRLVAPVSMWAAGIDHMLTSPPSSALSNHHYLRAVVFGLAEQAAADAERKREEDRKAGRHRGCSSPSHSAADPVAEATRYAKQMLEFGRFTQEEHDKHIADAQERAAQ